ncbi:hypothetical protein DSUL_60292 [Desulfovibrionales bacterium]
MDSKSLLFSAKDLIIITDIELVQNEIYHIILFTQLIEQITDE